MHVEGELSVNHVTAPCEIQETEHVTLYANPVTETKIGEVTIPSGCSAGTYNVVGTNAAENSILCYDHSHNFKNLPLHLKSTNEGVRRVGEKCNNEKRAEAAAIENKSAADKVSP